MGSSSRTSTSTRSDTTNQQISTGQELRDDAVGVVGDGNEVSITRTDHGAIESGLMAMLGAGDLASIVAQDNADIARESVMGARDNLETALSYSGDAMAESLRVASDVMNESGINVLDAARMANETAQQSLDSSLMFADSQNERLANTLGDNSALTQQALLELSERQERGLDSALDVAESVAMNDNIEGANTQTKYFALAAAAIGVAWALRARA